MVGSCCVFELGVSLCSQQRPTARFPLMVKSTTIDDELVAALGLVSSIHAVTSALDRSCEEEGHSC